MSASDIPWIVWGAVVIGGFLALELPALHRYPSGTLTARLRVWLGISPLRPIRRTLVPLFVALIFALPTWLIVHLTY